MQENGMAALYPLRLARTRHRLWQDPAFAYRCGAFSLTEVLVVVAVVVLLVSLILAGGDRIYVEAMRLRCQHRLEQLGHACQMFANEHGGQFPKTWDNAVAMPDGSIRRERWYGALKGYVADEERVFTCPSETELEGETTALGASHSGRILYYHLGVGRRNNGSWGSWNLYTMSRDWLADPHRLPQEPRNVPFDVDYGGGTGPDDLLTAENLAAYDQVWILGTITYGNGFLDSELEGLRTFYRAGGGIHLFAESHYGQWIEPANALSDAVGYDIRCHDGELDSSLMQFEKSDHPVMAGVHQHATNNTPARLELGESAFVVASESGFGPLIAAHDAGAGRVLVHGSFTTPADSHWPETEADCKQYCVNAAEWLFGGRYGEQGRCSYGYNNQISVSALTPNQDTILIMDYLNWEIHRGNADPERNDPDSYIATRHGSRANALMTDGSVRCLRTSDILPGMWTPGAGD
jgi:prepilin-type processing-associated H-X9-DG protein